MSGSQTGGHANVLSGTLAHFKAGMFLLQWIGNLCAILLAFAWLQIPDSHAWQFILSMLFGALIVVGFLWLHATAFRRMCRAAVPVAIPVQVLILAVCATLWVALSRPMSAGRDVEALFAGYVNSQLSAHLRSFFTFARLVQWQDHLYDLAQLIVTALFLPVAMEAVSSGVHAATFKRAGRVYLHWTYWIVAVVSGIAGMQVTAALVGWTPGKGIVWESLSVIARVGAAYSFDILLWCLVLALTAFYLDEARELAHVR
jgi:hypothetical protein